MADNLVSPYEESLFYVRWESEEDRQSLDDILKNEDLSPREILESVSSYVVETDDIEKLMSILEEGYGIEPVPIYSVSADQLP